MKISLHWLKDYVPCGISTENLAHRLTMAGLEVEKIEPRDHDAILELEITPNRPDCLNYLGIAREVAAIFNKNLNVPKIKSIKLPTSKCPIDILDREGCLRYIGTIVRGVKPQKSSDWLRERLEAADQRLINNVVDITNFSLLENGQPLHAFDYDKLEGGKIVVRRARAGEKIVTIDGFERTLDPSILVIADARKPVAIAGVMGGKETEVTEQTQNILLESAYFNPILIRRASRKLGLSSDSSYRFERGVDMENVAFGSARALDLILQSAGGKVTEHQDLFPAKRKNIKATISIKRKEFNDTLGAEVTALQAKTILKKLGFTVKLANKETLNVVPPAFRNDVRIAEDIIEEIARIIGYDNLPMSLPQVAVSNVPISKERQHKEELRTFLVAQGLCEIIAHSLINLASLEKSRLSHLNGVAVLNPLSQEQELLRPSTLPSFLSAARLNIHRGQRDLRLFEIGKIYGTSGEHNVIAVLLAGRRWSDWRLSGKEDVDFYDIKGVVEKTLIQGGSQAREGQEGKESIFQPGQAGQYIADGKTVAIFGKVHPEILQDWDIKQTNIFFAQIDLEYLCAQARKRKFKALPDYPAIVRDVSLAVKKEIRFEQVKQLAFSLGGELLVDILFIEQYIGEKISVHERGLVFSLVYQSAEKTLTEDEVNQVHGRICQALVEKLQAKIR